MRPLTTPWLLVTFVACVNDVGTSRQAPIEATVRDSAGIEIVENQAPAWPPGEGWTVGADPAFIIQASDGGDETLPLDPTSIDVDERGRIIVGDGNQVGWDAILVYDSLGHFLFRAGGPGQGPGEFGQLWWASAYRGDSVVAFDMAGSRLSVFSPDGQFVRALRTPALPGRPTPRGSMGYTAGADAAYGDGYFLAYPPGSIDITDGPGPAWFRHLLLRLNPTGESWDTLGSFEISQQFWTGTNQEQYWFAPFAVSAVGHDVLYFGRGEAFEFGIHDGTGRLRRMVRRSHAPRPVTQELRDQLRDWYMALVGVSQDNDDAAMARVRQQIEDGRISETLPPYSAMVLDRSGHLWVEEFRWFFRNERSPVSDPTQWSVFTPEGTWLGNVETPPGFILNEVTNDLVLGFVVNALGLKSIYAYPLRRGR